MEPVTNYCAAILGENRAAMSAIRLIPQLADCSADLLEMIYAYSKTVDAEPGEILIQEGMFDQWVYFIIRGELEVMINGSFLGTTQGPVVGERCILGEPRGADLVAGKTGVMALGVELSIIDELNRDINNFQQTAASDEEAQTYANTRMGVALELYTIILNDVTARIAALYDSGKTGARRLEDSGGRQVVKTRDLFEFSAGSSTGESGSDPETARQFLLYSFSDFAEIVYFELLQKHLSELGFTGFPLEDWKERFAPDSRGSVTLQKAFAWLHADFNVPNTELVQIAGTIFEVASRYTAASNKALNQVFSAFDREEDRKKARETPNRNRTQLDDASVAQIRRDLFDPVEAGRKSADSNANRSGPGKMSQADIDALFG